MMGMLLSGVYAEEPVNTPLYSLTIRSTYQVNNGGSPEYVIEKEDGSLFYAKVTSLDGATVSLPQGSYKVRETVTTKGFKPMAKGDVYVNLPHKDENGEYHSKVIIEMKSERVDGDPIKESEKPKDSPEIAPEDPTILSERPKDEKNVEPQPEIQPEPKEEPEEPQPEPEKEEMINYEEGSSDKAPKTGDSFYLEVAGICFIVLMGGVLYVIWRKKERVK